MLDVLHQRLNGSAAVSIVPCNDVIDRIGFWLSSLWAHVLILLCQSSKVFPCHEKGAPLRR